MSTVTLYIDGKAVEVPAGSTILQAAQMAGIAVPNLCHHPFLKPSGACRMCVVEVEGARALMASCTTPAVQDMRIFTESPRVVEARKTVLHLLLANHPLDCLTCEAAGDCQLQDYSYRYGVEKSMYQGQRTSYPVDASNPFFLRDYEKCILCGRCVRVCDEIMGVNAIDYAHRGFKTKIATAFDGTLQESPCVFCGNCVTACPVGALVPKMQKGQGRPWEIQKVRTVCSYCGVGCQIYLHVRNGKVVGVSPADGPANRELLCVKGRFGHDYLHHPERLTKPLIREHGAFREATWDEALGLVASRLSEIKEKHGPAALAGLASAKVTNEENYLMQKLVRGAFGTNNVDHCARLCHASSVAGLAISFGSGAMTNSIAETEGADAIFVIGSNTTEAHPVIGSYIEMALKRGARLVVADPRTIDLAHKADVFMQQMPGTDVALLNGMMNVILKERLYDKEFVAERTEGFAEFAETLESYSPEYVEGITGVPAGTIREAARLYAKAERAAIFYSMGITQHTTGTDNVMSIANLAMLTGNVGRESTGVNPLRGQNNVQGACDMGALPNVFPGYQKVDDDAARAKFEKAWGVTLPSAPGLTMMEMMNAITQGKIKGLYIMGENPMVSDPDLGHVDETLDDLEFLVVQDIFLTETAQKAHVVLPGAAFSERDGTFTNTERRVQLVHKAVDPPGDSLPDWRILVRVGRLMGLEMDYSHPSEIMAEIASLAPNYGGITHDRLGTAGLQWPCPSRDHPGTRFLHKGQFTRGKGKFMAVTYKPAAELPDEEYPLVLTTGRMLYHYHTGTMSRRSAGLHAHRPAGYVEINPKTAQDLGVEDGDMVSVESRRGRIHIQAAVTGTVPKRVVFIPFHFVEAAANVLTNPVLDPIAKIPELKVAAVRVRPSEKGGAGE
ncbi:MAG: formate dehydrogenase subunit alpha [Bacillota bacterium]